MPCNIGYKAYVPVTITTPAPVKTQPKKFEVKTDTPQLEADLLSKLGMEDPDFLGWLEEMTSRPLLEEALKRALNKITVPKGLVLEILNDQMIARGSFFSEEERKTLQKKTTEINGQFQMELFKIIAEILDYETRLTKKVTGEDFTWTLEGEKNETASVHKYLCVTKGPGSAAIEFEHFDSRENLDLEMDKFFALAQKLGLKITIGKSRKSGQPIPTDTVHKDFLIE